MDGRMVPFFQAGNAGAGKVLAGQLHGLRFKDIYEWNYSSH
jgi:hypothetical protein